MRPGGGRRRVWSRAPQAVLIDLDGTLFNHEDTVLNALTEWLPTVGLAGSPEVLDRWFDAEEFDLGRWRVSVVSWQEQRRLRLRMVVPPLEQAEDADLDAIFAARTGRSNRLRRVARARRQ